MIKKTVYSEPEMSLLNISPDTCLLTGSILGTAESPEYTDDSGLIPYDI